MSYNSPHSPFTGSVSSMSGSTSTITGLGPGFHRLASIAGSSAFDTSSTHTLVNPNDDDIDAQTSTLIAELLYSDLQEIHTARKGKSRSGAPLSDAEYALQLQSEQLEGMLNEIQDAEIARRMQDAMRSDQELIGQLVLREKAAQQDHEAALALSRGERLPMATKEQMAVERGVVRGDAFMPKEMLEALSPKLNPTPVNVDKGKGKAVSFGPSLSSGFGLPYLATMPVERPQCVSCNDRVPPGKASLKAPCEHHYCADCLVNLVRAATTDESLFPVRCCKKNIPAESLTKILPYTLLATFRAKSKEFGTPANARVYCSVATCSAFLGNVEEAKRQQGSSNLWGFFVSPAKLCCDKCRVDTCVECRQRAHPNDACKQNNAAQEVKELARAQGWQTCPSCERIIELSIGCNHMTCYCGFEFCYDCAAKWKTCGCEQWEERRLYATAEARMEREYGAQARVVPPAQRRREVEAFAQNLRVNHDCFPGHRWKGHGPGECEECGTYMPVFLRMCKDCRLTVCRRCSLNRL